MIFLGIAWELILEILLMVVGGVAVVVLGYRGLLFMLKDRESGIQYASMESLEHPVRGTVEISFELPVAGHAKVEIITVEGQVIQVLLDEEKTEGKHEIQLDTQSLADGVYHYRLITSNQTMSKKMEVHNKVEEEGLSS